MSLVAAAVLFWLAWLLMPGVGVTDAERIAASRGGYFPGAFTAPFLLVVAIWLALLLVREPSRSASAA